MDGNRVVEAFSATLNPSTQKNAEKYLDEIHKIINFGPTLLEIVAMPQLDISIRMAVSIYLKNFIVKNWETTEDPIEFSIHETDKQKIRDHILDVIIKLPQKIMAQLRDAISKIIKIDFPGKWESLPSQLGHYLSINDRSLWFGTLFVIRCYVGVYEYSTQENGKSGLFASMPLWMPLVKQRLSELLNDSQPIDNDNASLQHLIVKIFNSLVQFSLPTEMITSEEIGQWIQALLHMLKQQVHPELSLNKDNDELEELPHWKMKKWCISTLHRIFERYGSPGSVLKQYEDFAKFFLPTYSGQIIDAIFQFCDAYRLSTFVSRPVLRYCLNYIEDAIKYAFCWKLIKPHFEQLLREIIFPLLCHSKESEELFQDDPVQYIREHYDICEEFSSPQTRASLLLGLAAQKRKDVLKLVMDFSLSILNNDSASPRDKDGALHMIGSVSKSLLTRKLYKREVEHFLQRVVLPIAIRSPEGYRRVRALWILGQMAQAKFTKPESLSEGVLAALDRFTNDPALPVQVEAIKTVNEFLESHTESVIPIMQPHISAVVVALLKLLRVTHNDEVATSLKEFLEHFEDQVPPVALGIVNEIASLFHDMLVEIGANPIPDGHPTFGTEAEASDPYGFLKLSITDHLMMNISDDRVNVFNGMLQSIDLVLVYCQDNEACLREMEFVILQRVIMPVFEKRLEALYDEALSIVDSLTRTFLSPSMWHMLFVLLSALSVCKEAYISDYSQILYNFLTVDKTALRELPNNPLALIVELLNTIMINTKGDDDEPMHVAKLYEVILLEHFSFLDPLVVLRILEIVVERLANPQNSEVSEVRVLLLQVVIAAIYSSPQQMLTFLHLHPWPQKAGDASSALPGSTTILQRILELWITDTDCFLSIHDRKISILGLLTIMNQSPGFFQTNPDISRQLMPTLITLLDGITKAYEQRAADNASSSEGHDDVEEESEDEGDAQAAMADTTGSNAQCNGATSKKSVRAARRMKANKELDSDEDDFDEENERYLSYLSKPGKNADISIEDATGGADEAADDSDSDDEFDDLFDNDSVFELFTTHIDSTEDYSLNEFIIFMQTLDAVKSNQPAWYQQLIQELDADQKKNLEKVWSTSQRKQQEKLSKMIEQSGGYCFQQTNVPNNFNFENASLPMTALQNPFSFQQPPPKNENN